MMEPKNIYIGPDTPPDVGVLTFWHGCSEEAWEAIQAEGVLWGVRMVVGKDGKQSKNWPVPSRCTYLATDREEAACYGDVVLRVAFEPTGERDNWALGCWQCRVYSPIPIDDVQRVGDAA